MSYLFIYNPSIPLLPQNDLGWLTIKGKKDNKIQTVKTDEIPDNVKKKKKSRDVPSLLNIKFYKGNPTASYSRRVSG